MKNNQDKLIESESEQEPFYIRWAVLFALFFSLFVWFLIGFGFYSWLK